MAVKRRHIICFMISALVLFALVTTILNRATIQNNHTFASLRQGLYTIDFMIPVPDVSQEQIDYDVQSEHLKGVDHDCMSELFVNSIRSVLKDGKLSKNHCKLCEIFQGRKNLTHCRYHHPNTVHYIKLLENGSQNILTFREYVSIISVDKFYKPDKIIIHCNSISLTGPYWIKVSNLSTPIELRHTDRITSISNKNKKPGFITHEADYIKVSTALKEGGIYMDFDAVILNGTKLREMQVKSECVLGRDNPDCTQLCAGFYSCVPGSTLLKKWKDSYENDYRPSIRVYNAQEVPSQLLCDCPKCYDVSIDSRMSNWKDGRSNKWLKPGGIDWRVKAVAHYMNTGFMKPLKEPKELLKMNTPFTEMIKHVLGESWKAFLE